MTDSYYESITLKLHFNIFEVKNLKSLISKAECDDFSVEFCQ